MKFEKPKMVTVSLHPSNDEAWKIVAELNLKNLHNFSGPKIGKKKLDFI